MLRTLHITADEGSVGFQALLYLLNSTRLRLSFWADPCHRVANNLKLAEDFAGLAIIRMETMVCMKLPTGPWENHGFWQQIRGSANELHSRAGAFNPFFLALFDRIASDLGRPLDGTNDDLVNIWEEVRAGRFTSVRGECPKIGRWMSWHDKYGEFRKQWNIMFLHLLNMGMNRGWWPSVDRSPLYASVSSLVVDDEKVDEDIQAATCDLLTSKSVKDSNRYMNRLKRSSASNARLATMILASNTTHRCAEIKYWLSDPLRAEFGSMITMLKTPWGTSDWLVEMSTTGRCTATLQRIWETFSTAAGALSLTFDADKNLTEAERAEEFLLAKVAFDFTVSLIGLQSVFALWYERHLPGIFLRLLGKLEARREALGLLKAIFDKLTRDEQEAPSCTSLKHVLTQMQWPQHALVREWLVGLAEVNFNKVPTWIEDAVKRMARGLATSKIVEDMFKNITDTTRASPNGQMARKTRWVECIEGQTFADFGRPPVPSTAARVEGKRTRHLPSDIFDAKRTKFSLGPEVLQTLVEPAGWPNITPLALQQLPLLTSFWLNSPTAVSYKLGVGFLNLLCYVGTVLTSLESGDRWLVLHVCEWGIRGMRVRTQRINGVSFWEQDTGAGDVFGTVHIYDYEEWTAREVEPYSPSAFRELIGAQRGTRHGGIVLVKSKHRLQLGALAAKHGFDRLTVPMLRKLCQGLDMPSPPPG